MADIKINRRLNFVIPIDTDAGVVHIHSVPVSREIFDRYYSVIARTFATIYSGRYGMIAGPRVAAKILRTCAEEDGTWEGVGGVENGLMAEIKRLSTAVVPGTRGWETLLIEDAVQMGRVSEEDFEEVLNAIVFFCVASSMHNRKDLAGILGGASKLWGGSTTSLNTTEYAAGLTTSTTAGDTGMNVRKLSSIPS